MAPKKHLQNLNGNSNSSVYGTIDRHNHPNWISQTHLCCEVIPSRQVFEAEETVPLSGSTSTGVMVHDLAARRQEEDTYKH